MMKTISENDNPPIGHLTACGLDCACDPDESAPLTPSTAITQESIQAQLASRPPTDDVAQSIFSTLKRELEEYLSSQLQLLF